MILTDRLVRVVLVLRRCFVVLKRAGLAFSIQSNMRDAAFKYLSQQVASALERIKSTTDSHIRYYQSQNCAASWARHPNKWGLTHKAPDPRIQKPRLVSPNTLFRKTA